MNASSTSRERWGYRRVYLGGRFSKTGSPPGHESAPRPAPISGRLLHPTAPTWSWYGDFADVAAEGVYRRAEERFIAAERAPIQSLPRRPSPSLIP